MSHGNGTIRVIAWLLAAILAVPPTATDALASKKEKEPTGARIAGRVVGSDGKSPVEGAIVHVRPLEGEQTFSSRPTTRKGEFVITGIPYGYADAYVETSGGVFGGSEVLSFAPEGKLVVTFSLTRFEERSDDFWAGRDEEAKDLLGAEVAGLADTEKKVRGAEFWKSKAGIAVIGGIVAVVILGIAVSSRGSGSSSTTTTTTTP